MVAIETTCNVIIVIKKFKKRKWVYCMIRLMGKIVDNGQVVGYAVLDMDSNKAAMCNIQTTMTYVHTIGCVNAEIKDKKLVGTEASLNRLPEFNTTGNLVDKPKVSILGNIEKNGEIVGFFIMNPFGEKKPLSYSKTIAAIQECGCTNGKLVPRDGKVIVSAIQGTFESFNADGSKVDTVVETVKPKNDFKGDWGDYEALSRKNDFVFRNCSFYVLEKAKEKYRGLAGYAFPQHVKLCKCKVLKGIASYYGNDSYCLLTAKELNLSNFNKGFKVILVDDGGKPISKLEHKLILRAISGFNTAKKEIQKRVKLSISSKNSAIADIYKERLNTNPCKAFVKEFGSSAPSIVINNGNGGQLSSGKIYSLLRRDNNKVDSLISVVEYPADFIDNTNLYTKMANVNKYWKNKTIGSLWGTVNAYELYDISKKEVNTIINLLLMEEMLYYTKPRIGILMEAYTAIGSELPILEKMISIKEVDGLTTYTENKLQIGYNLYLNDLVLLVYLSRISRESAYYSLNGLVNVDGYASTFYKTINSETNMAISKKEEVKNVIKQLKKLDKNSILKSLGI